MCVFLPDLPPELPLGPGKKRCKNCMGGPDWDCINLKLKFQKENHRNFSSYAPSFN